MIVIEREVIVVPGLLSLTTCSLNQGLDEGVAAVTVTPPVPVPPPPALTVSINVVVRVRPPPVPVIVTFTVPVVAVLEAVRVSVLLVPVGVAGLNVAVTPVGRPLAVNDTPLANPPVREIVIVLVPFAPRLIVSPEGFADRAKSATGGALTVSIKVVVWDRPPPVPVIVTFTTPVVAVLEAARVSVLLVLVVDAGLKVAVTPLSKLLALNATLLVKPPERVILIMAAPLAPRFTVRLEGFADNVKSGIGGALIVSVKVVLRVSPPPMPVIVMFNVPVAAVLEAAKVSVLLVPVTAAGLKVAVAPLGKPLALKETLPVNPPERVIVMVLVPLAPRFTVRLDGFAESAKFGLLLGGPYQLRRTVSACLPRGL